MTLAANLTPTDHQRVKRLVLAWHDGDRLAMDTVLAEASHDPAGVPGQLFGLATFTVELAARLGVDDALMAGLRGDLLADADQADDDTDPAA